MRRARAAAAPLLLAFAVAASACGEETPTEIGDGLLPGEMVRTVEITLEPERYAHWDTAFSGFGSPAEAGFLLLADAFEGEVDVNVLARFTALPGSITATDTLGTSRVDSIPTLLGGVLLLSMDTLASVADGPVTVRVYRTTEEWSALTATWSLRINTIETQEPWSTPGGSRSAQVGEALWQPGEDTVRVAIDTLTMRAWSDLDDPARGALIVADGAGARLRLTGTSLRAEFRPSFNPDTLVEVGIPVFLSTFIYQPELGQVSSEARVGGVPSWRTILRLRERLDTLSVPCPGVPGCTMPLSQVTITRATLLLEQAPSPPGFTLEDSLRLVARTALVSDQVPLRRSPLGEIVGVAATPIPAGSDSGVHSLTITALVRALAEPLDAEGPRPPPFVALMPVTEGSTFGFARFTGLPRLQLTYTTATEFGF